jgi:outer membrane biosynthesis protein TonB
MAVAAPTQRILRVGVIQNGQVVEERIFRTREAITAGQGLKNSFVVASSAFPASLTLFEVKGGQYQLRVTSAMQGRVALADGMLDLASIATSGKGQQAGDGWILEIPETSRGKVTLGDTTLLFQFVAPPPLRVLPQLPANMRGNLLTFLASAASIDAVYLSSFALSLLLQGGTILYAVNFVPPPARDAAMKEMTERIIKIIANVEPPKPVEEEVPTEVDPNAEADEGVAEEAKVEAPPAAEPQKEAPPRTQEEMRAAATERVKQDSALAALFNSDSGAGPSLGISDSMSSRRADEVIANQKLAGDGTGIASKSGLGGSDGASGSVKRDGVDVSGSSSVGSATAGRVEGTTAAKVKPRLRAEAESMAGSGSLSKDKIREVIDRRKKDIERCYERELAKDPGLKGRLEIRWTIGEEGTVTQADVGENDLGSAVANCSKGVVRRWRFAKPEGGSITLSKVFILDSGN